MPRARGGRALLAAAAVASQLAPEGGRHGLLRPRAAAFTPAVGALVEEGLLRAESWRSPSDPSAHWSLGLFLAHKGDREGAEGSLEAAMQSARSLGGTITAYSIPDSLGGLRGYQRLLDTELQDFRDFCASSAAPQLAAQPRLRSALPAALEELQRLPQDESWQVSWAVETASMFGPDPASAAYGETPFSTVKEVMSHPAVAAAVAGGADRVVLLGSALGYQCLYFLAAGLECTGYDLLAESMVERGRDVLRSHGLGDAGVDLRVGDAREVALAAGDDSRPSVIWMNDEVWPEELREAMLLRATSELRPGSVLLSYGTVGEMPTGLRVVGSFAVKTSWDPEETVSVLQRAEAGSPLPAEELDFAQLQTLR